MSLISHDFPRHTHRLDNNDIYFANNYYSIYPIPDCPFDELPGDEDDVVTVTTEDDLDEVEVLCTSTNPVLLILLLGFDIIEVTDCCFKNSHRSPPTNPSPGSTHSLTTQTGSP